MIQRTFVMAKPDCVQRGLVGEIIATFERTGLKIVALKMLTPPRELAQMHYAGDREWLKAAGEKTKKGYGEMGLDAAKEFGTGDAVRIGETIRSWLVDFISSGKVVAMVFEGNAAVPNVRRLCGATFSVSADPGSIRGRFGLETPDFRDKQTPPVQNLVHASGNIEEAQREIKLWFPDLT